MVFLGFSFTYFGPQLAGEYPSVSPTVHVHGWTFFLWYALLPLQAGLVASRRIRLHRTLGQSSIVLAVAMVSTGLVVIGAQMDMALEPDGSPFWRFLGPTIFATLVLFSVFYTLALRQRRNRVAHRQLMLLASTGALGAAGFRVVGRIIGFGQIAGVIGILATNLIVVVALLLERRRTGGWSRTYAIGLAVCVGVEAGTMLLTPTGIGQALSQSLAGIGRLLAPLY